MNITQDDKQTLKVEEKNRTIVAIAGIAIAFCLVRTAFSVHTFGLEYAYYLHWIFLAAVAAFAGWRFTEEVTFTFDRTAKTVTWRRKKLLGTAQEGTLAFDEVEDVRIGYRGSGKRASYRIEFVVKGAPFPLSDLYAQGQRGQEACNAVARRMLEVMSRTVK